MFSFRTFTRYKVIVDAKKQLRTMIVRFRKDGKVTMFEHICFMSHLLMCPPPHLTPLLLLSIHCTTPFAPQP